MKTTKLGALALLLVLGVFASSAQQFTVQGKQLKDANGNNFIIRGINVPFGWYYNESLGALDDIRSKTNSNTIRIVWDLNKGLSEQQWKDAIQACIDQEMIPMFELHNVTGSNDANELNRMAQWYADRASYFKQAHIAKYILINIANEWGDWYMASPSHNPPLSDWRDAYKTAITTIRNAGITSTLVIDGCNYGQDVGCIKTYGQTLLDHDPQSNLLFSIHMYCSWTSSSTIETELQNVLNKNLAVIVGEFAQDHPPCGNLPEQDLMRICQEKGVGYLAWSWKGNSGDVSHLDMSNDWSGNNLTTWGNTAINNTNGIKNTAETCTVFGGTPPPTGINIALNKPVQVSSTESCCGNSASNAVDGNGSTRWSSAYSDPQYIIIDLGKSYDINKVVLKWETAYASAYEIQVSSDNNSWTIVYSASNSNGGTDEINLSSATGQYIKMYGTQRATSWGYSLWEFEVYGDESSNPPPSNPVIYEAEEASISGCTIGSNSNASNEQYVDMQGSGSITWTVNVTASGTYPVDFGYYLPYGYKEQILYVNGSNKGSIAFNEPINTWKEVSKDIYLNAGNNTIQIQKSWGYMYFDYIEIGNKKSVLTSYNNIKLEGKETRIYPNPIKGNLTLFIETGNESYALLSIYNSSGKKIKEMRISNLLKGANEIHLNTKELNIKERGIYFIQLKIGNRIEQLKIAK